MIRTILTRLIVLCITAFVVFSVVSFLARAFSILNATTTENPTIVKYEYDHVVLKSNNIKNIYYNVEFSEAKFLEALKYFDIKESKWVVAQAKLETGYYKSKLFKEHNNLFGIYNSKTKSFFKYKHWSESILAYKMYFQNDRRYNPSKYNNYGEYLTKIGYAEDKEYIRKLKTIM